MTEATRGAFEVPSQRMPVATVASWPYVDRRRSVRLATPHPRRRAGDDRSAAPPRVESRRRRAEAPQLRPVTRSWRRRLVTSVLTADVGAALVAAAVASWSRSPGDSLVSRVLLGRWGLPVLALTWLGCLYLTRALEGRFLANGPEESKRVLHAGGLLVVVLSVVGYATKSELSRGYVLCAVALATVGSLSGRWAVRTGLRRARGRGQCMTPTVLAGPAHAVHLLAQRLARESASGLEVRGVCVPAAEEQVVAAVDGVRVLGTLDDVTAAVRESGAGAVAVCACPEMQGAALRELAWQLEGSGVELFVAPGLLDVAGPRLHIRPVAGLSMLHVEEPELSGGRRFVKSVIDRGLSATALVLLAPALFAIAVAVRLTSWGPALYRQTRVGRNGRHFTVLKFRSMYADADQRLAEVADRNERGEGVLFKMRADPRVTPVGRWLRRFSLDELPQLINVLRGDMSLVGPRPPLPSEVERYGYGVSRRLLVKPGLTGLWQVSGRSDLTWDETVSLDLRYVENWSLMLDLSILLRTAAAVVRAYGAY